MSRVSYKSFVHATQGLLHAFQHHPNFKVHLLLSLAVLALAVLLEASLVEFTIIALTIAVGLALELVNTSVESVVDLVTKEWRFKAKIAKDTSAAAVLIYAIGAIIVATLIFFPKLLRLLT